jgi:hypothetical protein
MPYEILSLETFFFIFDFRVGDKHRHKFHFQCLPIIELCVLAIIEVE